MQLSFAPPSPLEYFATLVQSDDNFPLLEAAVSIGHIQTPELDVQSVLSQVDGWLLRLRRRVASDAAPLARLLALNQFFYKDLGFGGNLNDYYATGNSYIHALLESRLGIPISMAVVWLELAQGIGLNATGVSFPGHFLIKISLPMGQAVIDPLTGQSFSGEKLSEMLEPYRLSQDFEVPLGLYLQAAPARDILARMLRNLKEIFKSQKQWTHALEVQERLIILMPEAWTEFRDRGLAHAALGHHSQALSDLEHYLAHMQDVVDVDAIARQVEMLRAELGRRTEPN